MSGEMGWTPGPWYVVQSVLVHAPDYKRVATCNDMDRRPPEMQANARLTAAAPELYDGCNALLGLLQLLAGRDDINAEVRTCLTVGHRIADAEMAVRKAQGDAR